MREIIEYMILIHRAEEGGFWSEVPSLPGCFSQGETIEETISNSKEAIELHIQALIADNAKIPVEDDLIISHVKIESTVV